MGDEQEKPCGTQVDMPSRSVAREGRETDALIELALSKLGKATAAQIQEWIEKNKNTRAVKETGARLDENATSSKDRPDGMAIWRISVSSRLSSCSKFTLNKESRTWSLSLCSSKPRAYGTDTSKR